MGLDTVEFRPEAERRCGLEISDGAAANRG